MTEFWLATEWFIYGFAAGFFANPLWSLAKKIVSEAKLAREQWSKPDG